MKIKFVILFLKRFSKSERKREREREQGLVVRIRWAEKKDK
jgi:hypothetical protein